MNQLQPAQQMNQANRPRLIRMREILQRTGVTKPTIYAWMDRRDDPFPAPVRLGPRALAWVETEVDAWIDRRIAERHC